MKRKRVVACAGLLTLVLSACGQLPGVHVAIRNGGGDFLGGGGTDTGTTVDANGNPVTDASGNPVANGGGNGNVSGGGNGNISGGGGNGQVPGGPGDRTGITATTITIGVHAPVTGAAPVNSKEFEIGANLYWNYLKHKGIKVLGRDVKIVFENDFYKPSNATRVCDKMATSDHVFMLVGAAGTDQIQACSKYSNEHGIPYLSAGVTKVGVGSRSTYFAATATYPDQMLPLAQYICKLGPAADIYSPAGLARPDGTVTIEMVRPNTANFDDAEVAFRNAVSGLTPAKCGGAKYAFKKFPVAKEGTTTDAGNATQQMTADGADIASPITAPTFTIQLAVSTGKQGYHPKYMGVGITNNLNQGIAYECGQQAGNAFEGAMFLSPWPGWKNIMNGEYDPEYRDAIQYTSGASSYNTLTGGGDLMLALWGFTKNIYNMLLAAGNAVGGGQNLTRQNFIKAMYAFNGGTKGLFPNLTFTSSNHFGAGSQVHALVGHCSEPAGAHSEAGAQFIEDPSNPGLRSSF